MVTECELPPAQLLTEKPDKALARPGVYAILCDANGKYYVGSSRNIRRRFRQHVACLRGNRHSSKKLQRDFNSLGQSRFVFKAVEFVDASKIDVFDREQEWMISLDCNDSGYNFHFSSRGNAGIPHSEETRRKISEMIIASSEYSKAPVMYEFISPDGSIHSGKNIADFCRRNGMGRKDAAPLSAVLNGTKKSHKGWTSEASRLAFVPVAIGAPFILQSPRGEIVKGNNLEGFCRDSGLSYFAMGNVMRGTQSESNGWRLPAGVPTNPKMVRVVRNVISPDGVIHEVSEPTKFCRDKKLCLVSFYRLFTGVLSHHKGWRKA